MLLPIDPETPRSKVLQLLNRELGHFLRQCVNAQRFARRMFSSDLQPAIYGNVPTKEKFRHLWDVIRPLPASDRQDIADAFDDNQDVAPFFSDTSAVLPALTASVVPALKALTNHLFERTSNLRDVVLAAGDETLHVHYNCYQELNGNICPFCGSSELSQFLAGTEIEEQWRPDYDHLLAREHYPLYSVHHDNLVPACDTCNSKAKARKDLLRKQGTRRPCFYPYSEHARDYVSVKVEQEDMGLAVKVMFDPTEQRKLDAWNDLYRIRDRVLGKFKAIETVVDNDCRPRDLEDLRTEIARRAEPGALQWSDDPWNIWRRYLYEWLNEHSGEDVVASLWKGIEKKRDDRAGGRVFGALLP